VFFDRLNEDKSAGFRYTYNEVYALDHLVEFLEDSGEEYGDVLISPALPGGHGARVRGCMFTPNVAALEAYHAKYLEEVREHILAQNGYIMSMGNEKAQPKTEIEKAIVW
jgi:hypothetical protein